MNLKNSLTYAPSFSVVDQGLSSQYVAKEIFAVLPADLQIFSYTALQDDPHLGDRFGDPISMTIIENLCSIIPVSVTDSLETYGILPSQSDLQGFLTPVLQEYVNTVAAPPPVWSSTRASACEICERSWVPLTYHHLVPKQIHAKALKRKWHPQWRLNSVAWLCRACHSFVHRVANNEELAKDYWTIDKLTERDDVISWSQWVGRIRWKPR